MKKLTILLLTILLIILCIPALAGTAELTLRPSDDEVRVYAIPSMKANIIGYIIVGGRQEVQVLSVQGEWVQVRFTTVSGLRDGWVPYSCFETPDTATPTPTAPPQLSGPAFICNPQPGYRLNLRNAPSAEAVSLGKYYTGAPVALTGVRRNGYLQASIGSVQGWVDERYVTTDGWSFVNELPQVSINNRGSGANLRAGASTSTPIIGWYPHGASVTILGVREDEWYHVAVAGQMGYMSSTLLSQTFPWHLSTDSDAPAISGSIAAGSSRYVSASQGAHLRVGSSMSSRSLGVFYSGCPVNIISYTRTGWVYVRIGELSGYMDSSCLTATRPNLTGRSRTIVNPYGTGLNLRTLPTTDSSVLRLCRNHTAVSVLGDLADGWCYVQTDGQCGYMMGSRLVP